MADKCKFDIKNKKGLLDLGSLRGWICGWNIEKNSVHTRLRLDRDVKIICFLDNIYNLQKNTIYN